MKWFVVIAIICMIGCIPADSIDYYRHRSIVVQSDYGILVDKFVVNRSDGDHTVMIWKDGKSIPFWEELSIGDTGNPVGTRALIVIKR